MKKTEHDFKLDDNIIYSIIQKQAGTLQKAFLELVMNSIDAGASKVDIRFDGYSFEMVDDGKGFENEEMIHSFFGTFGTPHTEGDCTYGKFRMGRGQIMAFSKNNWYSNVFSMEVDVKNNGTKYNLKTDNDFFNGCKISGTLYDELEPYEIKTFEDELKSFVKFSQIPIHLNGNTISENINDISWDLDTEDAYIKVSETQKLRVYNLGVKVCEYSSYNIGFGGTIVSKKQLEVNFARNDILTKSCPVWKGIKKDIDEILLKKSKKSIKRNTDLSEEERVVLSKKLITGELDYEMGRKLKLFEDVNGKFLTIIKLLKEKSVTKAKRYSGLGDKVQMRKLAFVLNEKVLDNFGCGTLKELFEKLSIVIKDNSGYHSNFHSDRESLYQERVLHENIDVFAEAIKTSKDILEEKDLTLRQQLTLKVLRRYEKDIRYLVNSFSSPKSSKRKIVAGRSQVADGWTDGATYIAVEYEKLKLGQKGTQGFTNLALLLLHEYIHIESDLKTHSHNAVFYEIYHNASMFSNVWNSYTRSIGDIAQSMTKTYFLELEKNQIKVPQTSMILSSKAYKALFRK